MQQHSAHKPSQAKPTQTQGLNNSALFSLIVRFVMRGNCLSKSSAACLPACLFLLLLLLPAQRAIPKWIKKGRRRSRYNDVGSSGSSFQLPFFLFL